MRSVLSFKFAKWEAARCRKTLCGKRFEARQTQKNASRTGHMRTETCSVLGQEAILFRHFWGPGFLKGFNIPNHWVSGIGIMAFTEMRHWKSGTPSPVCFVEPLAEPLRASFWGSFVGYMCTEALDGVCRKGLESNAPRMCRRLEP